MWLIQEVFAQRQFGQPSWTLPVHIQKPLVIEYLATIVHTVSVKHFDLLQLIGIQPHLLTLLLVRIVALRPGFDELHVVAAVETVFEVRFQLLKPILKAGVQEAVSQYLVIVEHHHHTVVTFDVEELLPWDWGADEPFYLQTEVVRVDVFHWRVNEGQFQHWFGFRPGWAFELNVVLVVPHQSISHRDEVVTFGIWAILGVAEFFEFFVLLRDFYFILYVCCNKLRVCLFHNFYFFFNLIDFRKSIL